MLTFNLPYPTQHANNCPLTYITKPNSRKLRNVLEQCHANTRLYRYMNHS